MIRFLLIRHADSEAEKFIPGRMPGVHLSKKGNIQAYKLAEKLSKFKVDKIISSPLERVLETAWHLAARLGIGIDVNNNFTEVDFGDWTGKSFDEMEYLDDWKLFHVVPGLIHIPNGELLIGVQNRMVNELEIYKEKYTGKNICIFSHNDPLRLLTAYYLGIPLSGIHKFKADTSSLTIIYMEGNDVLLKGINIKDIDDYL